MRSIRHWQKYVPAKIYNINVRLGCGCGLNESKKTPKDKWC